jgi:hypothetical protein
MAIIAGYRYRIVHHPLIAPCIRLDERDIPVQNANI